MTETIGRAEAYVVWKLAAGEVADLQADEASLAKEERVLSANFIRGLILGLAKSGAAHAAVEVLFPDYGPLRPEKQRAPFPVALPGVRVRNAEIEGCLDLRDCRGNRASGLGTLSLESCELLGGTDPDPNNHQVKVSLDISHARLARVSLRGSRLTYLRGQGVQINGSLDLTSIEPLNGWKSQAWPCAPLQAYGHSARIQVLREFEAKIEEAEAVVAALENRRCPKNPTEPPKKSIPIEQQGKLKDNTEGAVSLPVTPSWPASTDAHCWINLTAASIEGRLILNWARLRTPPPRPEVDIKPENTNFCVCFERGEARTILGRHLVAEGGIGLASAQINGDVQLVAARLTGAEGPALTVESARINGSLLLYDIFEEERTELCNTVHRSNRDIWTINLYESHIGGGAHFGTCHVDGAESGLAIDARHTRFGGTVIFAAGSICKGIVNFDNAYISSQLRIDGNTDDVDGCLFVGSQECDPTTDIAVEGRSRASGSITFNNTHIAGNVLIRDSIIIGDLQLSNIEVDGDFRIIGTSVSDVNTGETKDVHLWDTKIHGSLYIGRVNIYGDTSLQNLTVDGDLRIFNTFVYGSFDLSRSKIEGQLVVEEVFIEDSLVTSYLTVQDSVKLLCCAVKGIAKFDYSTAKYLLVDDSGLYGGFDAIGVRLSGTFEFSPSVIDGNVNFKNLQCREYCDNASTWRARKTWLRGALELDGLIYERIRIQAEQDGRGVDKNIVRIRRNWLSYQYRPIDQRRSTATYALRKRKFQPHPYVQLSKTLAQQGYEQEAREILIRGKVEELKTNAASSFFKVWRWPVIVVVWLYGLLFGYGLRPGRAIFTMIVYLILGAVFVETTNRSGALVVNITPVAATIVSAVGDRALSENGTAGVIARRNASTLSNSIPCRGQINSVLYAIDIAIPFINLKQESRCDIGISPGFEDRLNAGITIEMPPPAGQIKITYLWIIRLVKGLYTIIGYTITSLVTLTLSGVVRRWEYN